MKYISILFFLLLSVLSFSQEYIEPITLERVTGKLPQQVDSMILEQIIGDSKFVVPHQIWSTIYSPDGKYIIIGGYNFVGCFDQKTGKRIWGTFLNKSAKYTAVNPIRALALHQETNNLLVGSDDGKARLLNFKTGEIKKILATDWGWIMAVNFSPNGEFAAATDIKGVYKMWDLKREKSIKLPKISSTRGEAVCFSSNNRFLAIGFNDGLQVIDWENQTATQYESPSTVQSVAFINDDREVIITGWTGFLQRIHLKSKEVLWERKISDWLINLQILPNKTSALGISPFHVWHFDWENNTATNTNIAVRTAMDLSPDGQTIITVGNFANRVEQFNWKTKAPVHNSSFTIESPMKLAFSPDGKYLATGSNFAADKAIIWNTENWNVAGSIEFDKQHRFNWFGFTKDGKYFYANLSQNNIRIPQGNFPTYYEVPTFEPAKDGKGHIHLYHYAATNLESTQTISLKNRLPIPTAAYLGDLEDSMNRHLFGGWTIEEAYFAGITNEHILYIYDSETGAKIAGTPLPDFGILACAIHPEAKIVAVTAWDGLIYIYKWME